MILDGKGIVQSTHVGYNPDAAEPLHKTLATEIDALLEGKSLAGEKDKGEGEEVEMLSREFAVACSQQDKAVCLLFNRQLNRYTQGGKAWGSRPRLARGSRGGWRHIPDGDLPLSGVRLGRSLPLLIPSKRLRLSPFTGPQRMP